MDRDVTVREVVNREYVGVSESDELVETAELLVEEETSTAVVLRGSEPVGIVTDRDVLTLLTEGTDPEEATVADAMQTTVPTIEPDATLGEAVDRMSADAAEQLVVTDGDEPLGVITGYDLLVTRPALQNEPSGGPGEEVEEVTRAAPGAGAAAGVGAAGAGSATESESEEGFQDQSICEGCGRLTSDLVSFNGQLLCSDCRDM